MSIGHSLLTHTWNLELLCDLAEVSHCWWTQWIGHSFLPSPRLFLIRMCFERLSVFVLLGHSDKLFAQCDRLCSPFPWCSVILQCTGVGRVYFTPYCCWAIWLALANGRLVDVMQVHLLCMIAWLSLASGLLTLQRLEYAPGSHYPGLHRTDLDLTWSLEPNPADSSL